MAFKNKIIRNAKTGQEIRFLLTGKDTQGKLLEMEATYAEHSEEPVGHYLPFQTEAFTIISGFQSHPFFFRKLFIGIVFGKCFLKTGFQLRDFITANFENNLAF